MNVDQEGKPVELRSEEFHDILGKIPPWILRYGITLVACIVVVLLIGSWFFKYPEIISSTMTLTGGSPPSPIIARAGGRLMKIYIKDNDTVEKDKILAIIENPASLNDILLLKSFVSNLIENPVKITQLPIKELKLGEIQNTFTSFSRCLDNYFKFQNFQYYPQKIKMTEQKIIANNERLKDLTKQSKIIEKQYEIATNQFKRDSVIFHEVKAISPAEYDDSRNKYLQNELSLENSYHAIKEMKIRIKDAEESLLDVEQQYNDQLKSFHSEINNLAVFLMNDIKTWELNYLLISPLDGIITFNSYWSENQTVIANEKVFTVIPSENGKLTGKALLAIERSGKVKPGQKVNIRFINYPEKEFGTVKGEVQSISLVPVDNNYTVDIILPNGLKSSYSKELPFTPEMHAKADIITDDLRLLERLFMPLKKIFAESK